MTISHKKMMNSTYCFTGNISEMSSYPLSKEALGRAVGVKAWFLRRRSPGVRCEVRL